MGKEKFLEHLKSLRMIDEEDVDELFTLKKFGFTSTFKYLTEEEARFAAKYLRRYPHIYYSSFIRCVFGVSELKRIDNYTPEIKEVIWEYHRVAYHQYVGPFFITGKKIKALKTNIVEGNINEPFINSPVSHFDFFQFLGFKGDYGNYPRGRVIYNNNTNEFYLYIDSMYINNEEVIDQVMLTFNLCSYNTIVKTDEHYTHDNL